MIVQSPYNGKPMRVVYEDDTWVFRGEKYPYVHIAFYDEESGERFTTTQSDTVCFEQVGNQYRAKYGVPYTDEIIALRKRYGVSAAKMSAILGFGVNQYRLYEMGEIPSESNGKMIRAAMNPEVFMDLVQGMRHNLSGREYERMSSNIRQEIAKGRVCLDEQLPANRLFLSRRGPENGFAPRSTSRLRNLLLHILGQMGCIEAAKLDSVLFYIDFVSYRECGMAISGLAYNAIEIGPVPQRWDRVYSAFDEIVPKPQLVNEQESVVLTSNIEADMDAFSQKEMGVVGTVCEKLKDLSLHAISEMSRMEPAWKKYLNRPGTIPYSEAFCLVGM